MNEKQLMSTAHDIAYQAFMWMNCVNASSDGSGLVESGLFRRGGAHPVRSVFHDHGL